MSGRRPVVVEVVRSPFGKGRTGGALAGEHPVDLLASVLQALLQRTGLDPARVDDVIAGCTLPVAEQSGNVARHALLAAGMPVEVPGVSIDRKCGSFQQALHFAAQGVAAGAYDIAIACGVEMMSTVPMRANRMGRDDRGPRFRARFGDTLVSQGISAELIAARWKIQRSALDAFALRSHRLATLAVQEGRTARRIVPVQRADGVAVSGDEGIRPTTTAEALAALPPSFRDDTLTERFPEIGWRVTAGNSSPITDGAAATLVMAEETAAALGLTPLAAVSGYAVVGDDPLLMLTGVVPATRKLLDRHHLRSGDVDLYEVNEAFASVVLAWTHELGVELDRVNVDGGAIAYGHPVGASGGRLLAAVVDNLARPGVRRAVMTMCESGGMANATLLEAP
ncbi:thiolase family protein [Pseudonocardia dioxanivorans]|uniref:thiolase family protein n=1 Tax=Pseudonocardia dioxanivorans TaxID=240495 RepID=UPI000CD01EC7|nr:thiolase family protein [Pseudonocardia dioxanivorans]